MKPDIRLCVLLGAFVGRKGKYAPRNDMSHKILLCQMAGA